MKTTVLQSRERYPRGEQVSAPGLEPLVTKKPASDAKRQYSVAVYGRKARAIGGSL